MDCYKGADWLPFDPASPISVASALILDTIDEESDMPASPTGSITEQEKNKPVLGGIGNDVLGEVVYLCIPWLFSELGIALSATCTLLAAAMVACTACQQSHWVARAHTQSAYVHGHAALLAGISSNVAVAAACFLFVTDVFVGRGFAPGLLHELFPQFQHGEYETQSHWQQPHVLQRSGAALRGMSRGFRHHYDGRPLPDWLCWRPLWVTALACLAACTLPLWRRIVAGRRCHMQLLTAAHAPLLIMVAALAGCAWRAGAVDVCWLQPGCDAGRPPPARHHNAMEAACKAGALVGVLMLGLAHSPNAPSKARQHEGHQAGCSPGSARSWTVLYQYLHAIDPVQHLSSGASGLAFVIALRAFTFWSFGVCTYFIFGWWTLDNVLLNFRVHDLEPVIQQYHLAQVVAIIAKLPLSVALFATAVASVQLAGAQLHRLQADYNCVSPSHSNTGSCNSLTTPLLSQTDARTETGWQGNMPRSSPVGIATTAHVATRYRTSDSSMSRVRCDSTALSESVSPHTKVDSCVGRNLAAELPWNTEACDDAKHGWMGVGHASHASLSSSRVQACRAHTHEHRDSDVHVASPQGSRMDDDVERNLGSHSLGWRYGLASMEDYGSDCREGLGGSGMWQGIASGSCFGWEASSTVAVLTITWVACVAMRAPVLVTAIGGSCAFVLLMLPALWAAWDNRDTRQTEPVECTDVQQCASPCVLAGASHLPSQLNGGDSLRGKMLVVLQWFLLLVAVLTLALTTTFVARFSHHVL